jgi:foldase protein PrsA
MKKKLTPILISLGIVGLAGCANDSGEDNEASSGDEVEFGDVLSSSDAGDITSDDILNELGTQQVATQTFQLTLDQILMDKYSDEVDADQISEDVDKEIEDMGGKEQFEMMLQQQQQGMDADTYKEQRVKSAYHDQFFAEQFDISDEEAKEDVREGAHILVSVADEGEDEESSDEEGLTDEEAKEKAEDLIQQIDDGKDFGELASEESDDPGSASNNGDLGFVQKGQMVEEFENALFDLEPGEMTEEPVKSEHGYHIIMRGEEENIDDELPDIKRQIVNQKVQEDPEAVLNMYKELLDEYNVEFENEDIKTFIEETYLQDEENADDNADSEGAAEDSTETEDNSDANSESEE